MKEGIMIIQQVFKTYKDDFPLIATLDTNQILPPPNYNIVELKRKLILELAEISHIPLYCYITRHDDDEMRDDILLPFLNKFTDFENYCENNLDNLLAFRIPTIWYVAYVNSESEVKFIEEKLLEKNIGYQKNEDAHISDSIDSIKPDKHYTTDQYEASNFPIFLHQVTQIGIDLLKRPESIRKLKELRNLEGMIYTKADDKRHDLLELRKHLIANSKYYKENIGNDNEVNEAFWFNFQRVYDKYSWPHFLFNICDVHNIPD